MKIKRTYSNIGLDIGSFAIKMVKLRFIKDTAELCDFKLEPAQADLIQALKTITQSQNIKRANISVCGPSAVIRYANFPQMNAAELRNALKFEAQKYVPFSISEVNLDSGILKSDLPDNKMLVLLAAVKKELISQRLKLMEEAGLDVNIIDIDSLALINAFNFNYAREDTLRDKTIALLNIGSTFSNLNILESGIPRLSRDIQIAGNNFTEKLKDAFRIDFASAEALKINPDRERLSKAVASVESVLSVLAEEIRQSFDYYESQSASSVDKIFLSGSGSKFSGLKDILASLLGIAAEPWDPLSKINISGSIDAQEAKALSAGLAVAVGLALRY